MVRILRGEFAKSREPSDLAEEQGSYSKPIFKFKFRRNQTVGYGSTRTVGSFAKSHFVDSRGEGLKPLPQDLRGHERRSPEGAKGFM